MGKNSQQHTIEELQNIINSQHGDIEYRDFLISCYQNSFSWKVTAPLRGAGQLLRKVKHKVCGVREQAVPAANESMEMQPNCTTQEIAAFAEAEDEDPRDEYINYLMSIPFEGKNGSCYVEKTEESAVQLTEEDVKYIAFYLPQYHAFPENDAWWGKNFTEWTNVTKAVPQFTGHYQPRLAGDLGYYNLKYKETIREQMELAKQYGVYGFCIYYYWFDGKKLMETPLDTIMQNPDLDLPFCICWANENWSRRWDGKAADILIAQNYDENFPEKFIRDAVVYMKDARYIKMNGKPVLVIYNANEIPDLKNVLEYWREYCRKDGMGEIHIAAVDFALNDKSKHAGFDNFIEFPPHSVYNYPKTLLNDRLDIMDDAYMGSIYDYQEIVERKDYLATADENLIPGIFLGWDNTARKKNASTVYHNYSPEAFEEWLTDITNYSKAVHPAGNRFVFINAWNEWAEGTYLEPDRRYGYAALEAVRNTLQKNRESKRIIYVCHDAWFNGAQILSLNIIRSLSRIYGYDVYLLLKEGGIMKDEFRDAAKEMICLEEKDWDEKALHNWIKATGARIAICNTVVSGDMVGVLDEAGIRVISLIHEMEKVIIDRGCQNHLRIIAEHADKVVYASDYVRKSGDHIYPMPDEKVVIKPQGLYNLNQYLDQREETKKRIYDQYHIAENQKLVIGVGYGDYRKGVDLFLKTAMENIRRRNNITFMWVGELSPEMEALKAELLTDSDLTEKILFAGKQIDPMPYYTAADLFLLTSREDPFPTVVMEAMHSYLPVIAFSGGGGYVEIITKETGRLVEMEDYRAMAERVEYFTDHEEERKKTGEYAHDLVAEKFRFHVYVSELLKLLGEEIPSVSVVIPNYNYERYLRERIDSVLYQDYPIQELLLLDDCSSDHSVGIMEEYRARYPELVQVCVNEKNAGNVFRQWKKGFELAKGEYVWIAEADDLSDTQFLGSVMGKMSRHSDMVMCYAQSKMMDENGTVTADNYFCYTDDIDDRLWKEDYCISSEQELRRCMTVKNTIPNVSGVVFKNGDYTEALNNAMQYTVAGDWRVYVDILKQGGKFGFVSESLNYHRRHSNSVTTDLKAEKHYAEVCEMQEYVAELVGMRSEKIEEYREYLKEYLNMKD